MLLYPKSGVQHGFDENPDLPPRVVKVDLFSGKAHREPGVAYQCHLVGGKHTSI